MSQLRKLVAAAFVASMASVGSLAAAAPAAAAVPGCPDTRPSFIITNPTPSGLPAVWAGDFVLTDFDASFCYYTGKRYSGSTVIGTQTVRDARR